MSNRNHGVRNSHYPHRAGERTGRALLDRRRFSEADVRHVTYLGPAGGGLEHRVLDLGSGQVYRVKAPPGFRAMPRSRVIVGSHTGVGEETILSAGVLPNPSQPQFSSRKVSYPAPPPLSKEYLAIYDDSTGETLSAWKYLDGSYDSTLQTFDYSTADWNPDGAQAEYRYVASTNEVTFRADRDAGGYYAIAWSLTTNTVRKSQLPWNFSTNGLLVLGDTLYTLGWAGTDNYNASTHALSTLETGSWSEQTGINETAAFTTSANLCVTGNGALFSPTGDNDGWTDGRWWKHPGTDNPLTPTYDYNGYTYRYETVPVPGEDRFLVWSERYCRPGSDNVGLISVALSGVETYITPASWEDGTNYAGRLSLTSDGSEWVLYEWFQHWYSRYALADAISEGATWEQTAIEQGPGSVYPDHFCPLD